MQKAEDNKTDRQTHTQYPQGDLKKTRTGCYEAETKHHNRNKINRKVERQK